MAGTRHPQFTRVASNAWKAVAGVFVVGWVFKWGMYYHAKSQMDRINAVQEAKISDHFAAENLKHNPMEGMDMERVAARVAEQEALWARRDAGTASAEGR